MVTHFTCAQIDPDRSALYKLTSILSVAAGSISSVGDKTFIEGRLAAAAGLRAILASA